MAKTRVSPSRILKGQPVIPGDKSVSHRGLIFGALSSGLTEVSNLLESEDVQSTARCLRGLGVQIEQKGLKTLVHGRGRAGFLQPREILDCGNSGTTIRLLMGVLSGQSLSVNLTGDSSLVKRPMKRVAEPLRLMGAQIDLTNQDFAPVHVKGGSLHGVNYELKIASAQIKTAIVMAALRAEGITQITGEIHSRDHTERLLNHFGAQVESDEKVIRIRGGQEMVGNSLNVPSDPSTAAFWLAAASLVPGAEIEMENISLNPTRTGFLRTLQKMGADIQIELTSESPEPVGRVHARYRELRGIHVRKSDIPSMIDEIPLLAVLATQAQGVTEVEGAEELRIKESDRLEAIALNLRAMGAEIEVRPDGFRIEGPQKLKGAEVESFHDHRIAMAFSIATLVASGPSEILGSECVGISYPDFFKTLTELTK
jgi:3-phosphoshikimate 1-carboxyvinyltransferase